MTLSLGALVAACSGGGQSSGATGGAATAATTTVSSSAPATGATTTAAATPAVAPAVTAAATPAVAPTVTATPAITPATASSTSTKAVSAVIANLDLSGISNVNALFVNGAVVTNGGADTNGYAYSRSLSGTSVTWGGSTFAFGAAGVLDAVSGATVSLPSGAYGTLNVLAAGVNGLQPNQLFTVTYTDGTTTAIKQSISDWVYNQGYAGESTVLTMPYRLSPTGAQNSNAVNVYGYKFALNSAKTVKSVALPANRDVVVLGMSLVPAGATASTASTTVSATSSGTTLTSVSGTPASTGTSASTASTTSSTSTTSAAATTGTVVASQEIVVNAGSVVAPITANQIGSNLGAWYDVTQPGVAAALQTVGAHLVRWPGGSVSDAYHWQTNGMCSQMGGTMSSNSTFDNVMNQVVDPNGLEAAVTVNYGSNAACNGGGNPAEAAAWVAYSKSKGYNVHHWTVGNEVYGGWELDSHAKPNDAATYAAAVGKSGGGGYYQQMKNADSSAQVGVVVEPNWNGWDGIVLGGSSYDFVELHWYAQMAGSESDSYLLTQAPTDFRNLLATLRSDLAAAGKPNTPIMIGEFNSVNQSPGKQTLSIVNALFMGMTYGEILNNNVGLATAWFGYGGTCSSGNNNSSSLYGWQNFGGYDQVSVGPYWWQNCGGSTTIPQGTTLPNGYAQQLVSQFAVPGGNMLAVSVGSGLPNVQAYAASTGSGYSLMLFNLSETASTPVTVAVAGTSSSTFSVSTITYGKAQYDNSKSNVWSGPVSQSLGTVTGTATITLAPWSMTVLKLH